MGWVPKSQSIQVQSPIQFPFSNVDLVWTPEMRHGGTNKVSIEIAYIAHACEFLEGERGDAKTLVEWNMHKNLPPQKDIKTPSIKNHLNHIWYNVMFHAFHLFFKCPSQTHMIFTIRMFCRYDCAYGLDDHHNDPNHARSIKRGCLAAFSIKRLYTQPNVVDLCFYHRTHTRMTGEPAHGEWDLDTRRKTPFFDLS
jgi:hypothetical protein